MADKKITALTAATALSTDDLFHVVDSPASSPSNKKITVSNVVNKLPTWIGFSGTGIQSYTSATSTAQETVDCEAADPDEYGNIVHWCDDGSYWWIDSVTGYRYEMDADGNGVSDDPAGYPIPELLSKGNDDFGETSLHDAAESNSLEVATLLIDSGVDIEAKDNGGRTALHIAAERNALEVATLLIDRGANREGIDLSWMN
mgnify:CR=1 FL=1